MNFCPQHNQIYPSGFSQINFELQTQLIQQKLPLYTQHITGLTEVLNAIAPYRFQNQNDGLPDSNAYALENLISKTWNGDVELDDVIKSFITPLRTWKAKRVNETQEQYTERCNTLLTALSTYRSILTSAHQTETWGACFNFKYENTEHLLYHIDVIIEQVRAGDKWEAVPKDLSLYGKHQYITSRLRNHHENAPHKWMGDPRRLNEALTGGISSNSYLQGLLKRAGKYPDKRSMESDKEYITTIYNDLRTDLQRLGEYQEMLLKEDSWRHKQTTGLLPHVSAALKETREALKQFITKTIGNVSDSATADQKQWHVNVINWVDADPAPPLHLIIAHQLTIAENGYLDLSHLNLSNTDIPWELIAQMTQITSIGLSDNKITSLEGSQFPKNLQELWLRNNQLTSLNGLTTRNLEKLHVSYNQLTSLEGLNDLNVPKYLWAINNKFRKLIMPDTYSFQTGRLSSLRVNNTDLEMLTSVSRQFYDWFCIKHPDHADVITKLQSFFPYLAFAAECERWGLKLDQHQHAMLKEIAESDPEGSKLFFMKFLPALCYRNLEYKTSEGYRRAPPADYKNLNTRPQFIKGVGDLLKAMLQPGQEKIRNYCYTLAAAGLENCGDGLANVLLQMQIATQGVTLKLDLNQSPERTELLKAGHEIFDRPFKNKALETFIRTTHGSDDPELNEIMLYYRIKLNEELKLGLAVKNMLYEETGKATPKQLEDAVKFIKEQKKLHAGTPKFVEFLATQAFWISYLNKQYPELPRDYTLLTQLEIQAHRMAIRGNGGKVKPSLQ